MIANLDVLGSLARDLHQSMSQLFYIMMPILILLSVIASYLGSSEINQADVLKRAFVASILLVSFPEISNLIIDICDGIALKIDNMNGIETFLRMAQEKTQGYGNAKNVLLLKFDDLFMAVLSFGSFIILYIARYITIALYYFYWILLSILSPLMILCYLFPRTEKITVNLYKGLIEVALWKVMWAVLSAMLTALAFGKTYQAEGSYLTLIVMNFVISLALLFTPMIVKSIVGEGIQSSAQTIGTTAAITMTALPARIANVNQISREVLNHSKSFGANQINRLKGGSNRFQSRENRKPHSK